LSGDQFIGFDTGLSVIPIDKIGMTDKPLSQIRNLNSEWFLIDFYGNRSGDKRFFKAYRFFNPVAAIAASCLAQLLPGGAGGTHGDPRLSGQGELHHSVMGEATLWPR
jgi:hypothetical protein